MWQICCASRCQENNLCAVFFSFQFGVITKHLVTEPTGNSWSCLPSTLRVSGKLVHLLSNCFWSSTEKFCFKKGIFCPNKWAFQTDQCSIWDSRYNASEVSFDNPVQCKYWLVIAVHTGGKTNQLNQNTWACIVRIRRFTNDEQSIHLQLTPCLPIL